MSFDKIDCASPAKSNGLQQCRRFRANVCKYLQNDSKNYWAGKKGFVPNLKIQNQMIEKVKQHPKILNSVNATVRMSADRLGTIRQITPREIKCVKFGIERKSQKSIAKSNDFSLCYRFYANTRKSLQRDPNEHKEKDITCVKLEFRKK